MKKKPLLSDFSLTEERYANYIEYKIKCKSLENKIEGKEEILRLVPFLLPIIVLWCNWENIILLTGNQMFLLLVILPILYFIGYVFIIPFGFLFLFIDHHVFCKIRKLLYKKPQREKDFDLAERYEKRVLEYETYIIQLGDKYPDIKDFDYDKQLYFKSILENILDFEKEFINGRIEQRRRQQEADYWISLDGFTFERTVAEEYEKLGYKVILTKAIGDGGIDIKLWDKDGNYIVVQCKNHKSKIGPSVIRDLYGVMKSEKANSAIAICSGGFTKGAYEFGKGKSIIMMDISDWVSTISESYTQKDKIIEEVQSCYNIKDGIPFKFRVLGHMYIYEGEFEKAEFIGEKVSVTSLKPIIYLFEELSQANKMVERLAKCSVLPSYVYEVGTWKIYKGNSYSYTSLYYIRAIDENHMYYSQSNNKTI